MVPQCRWVNSELCPLFMTVVGWSVDVKVVMGQQAHVYVRGTCCRLKEALAEVGGDTGVSREHCGAAQNRNLVHEEA